MKILYCLDNFESTSLCGNNSNGIDLNTDPYFAEEDEVVQQPDQTCKDNSNLSDPNTDHFFAGNDEVILQPTDEVNLSKMIPKLPTPMEHVTIKIEEYLIPGSGNPSPGLQICSCNSVSTNYTSSDDTVNLFWNFEEKYKKIVQSDSLVTKNLISPGSPDSDSDYDSHDGSVNKKKKKTKQNNKKNIPGLTTQKVKSAITGNHPFYIRARQRLGLSEKDDKELRKFAGLYHKQAKTWIAITKFLLKNSYLGDIYLQLINLFLSEENSEFYKEWVSNGRMNEDTKNILLNKKQFFVDKFRVLLSNDDEEEFERETPIKRRKTHSN